MKKSRRHFFKIAGISVLALEIFFKFDSFAFGGKNFNLSISLKKSDKALLAEKWGMVVDTRFISSLFDLQPMVDACNEVHNIPIGLKDSRHVIKWIWHDKFNHVFPDSTNNFCETLKKKSFPVLCNHCEKPPCVRACPTKATFKRDRDGIVLMDFHRCIGCRFCMAACPFGARSFNFRDPRCFIKKINKKFPTRMKGVVEKCNFCAERLARGEIPSCVEASGGILTFGDLRDPNSDVRKLLKENYTIRRKQNLGTGPSVYYIV